MAAFGTELSQAAWRSEPSWAITARKDKAFGERMLKYMARRISVQIVEVKPSRAVYLTQPKVVADLIARAARASTRWRADQPAFLQLAARAGGVLRSACFAFVGNVIWETFFADEPLGTRSEGAYPGARNHLSNALTVRADPPLTASSF